MRCMADLRGEKKENWTGAQFLLIVLQLLLGSVVTATTLVLGWLLSCDLPDSATSWFTKT